MTSEFDQEYRKNLASMLAEQIDELRRLMTDVATGGSRIPDVNEEYKQRRERISGALAKLGLVDPNPYRDLWDWYERWSTGDLPSYRSRRLFLRELFTPLEDRLKEAIAGRPAEKVGEPTGWPAVDRVVGKMRNRLSESEDAEDLQAVGLLARETLISLAQAVFDPEIHESLDGVKPSETDAQRMLGAFIAKEFAGSANDALRKHAKAALDLAVALQHKRTAEFRMAALCLEATASVVNIVAIASGRRDPGQGS